ncbi:MAG TPA: hypothetical protein VI731_10565 [Bacteroidia bacterium]|nr:hypothetical protein [Bacteroidia bacterium]
MKRKLLQAILLATLSLTLFNSCGNPTTQSTEDVVPAGWRAIDLTNSGQPLLINVPDSSYFPTVDTMETPTGIQVRVGRNFDLLVNVAGPEEADLEKQKALINATDAGANTFLSSDSATLIWETKFGELSMHHFYRIVKTAHGNFYVRDNNANTDNQFKKEDIDRMVESAKSLRAKPSAQPAA